MAQKLKTAECPHCGQRVRFRVDGVTPVRHRRWVGERNIGGRNLAACPPVDDEDLHELASALEVVQVSDPRPLFPAVYQFDQWKVDMFVRMERGGYSHEEIAHFIGCPVQVIRHLLSGPVPGYTERGAPSDASPTL